MKKDDLNKKQRYALDTMLSGSSVHGETILPEKQARN